MGGLFSSDRSGSPPPTQAGASDPTDVVEAYRRHLLAHGTPGDHDERHRQLDRRLQAHLSGRLWLGEDELATVYRFNERLRRERPDLVAAFVALIANHSPPRAPPTPVRSRSPPAASAGLNALQYAVRSYLWAAERALPRTRPGARGSPVEALMHRLDAVVRGTPEAGPLHLGPDEWAAVREINGAIKQTSPGQIDRFLYFVAPEGQALPGATGGDTGRLRSFDHDGEADWDRRMRRRY
jgi:hypothetical protein